MSSHPCRTRLENFYQRMSTEPLQDLGSCKALSVLPNEQQKLMFFRSDRGNSRWQQNAARHLAAGRNAGRPAVLQSSRHYTRPTSFKHSNNELNARSSMLHLLCEDTGATVPEATCTPLNGRRDGDPGRPSRSHTFVSSQERPNPFNNSGKVRKSHRRGNVHRTSFGPPSR